MADLEAVDAEGAAAAEADDLDTLADVFSPRGWEHPGADFTPLGFEYRSCSGLQF